MTRRNRRSYRVILVALIVTLVVPQLAMAAFVKLSVFGSVWYFRITPDGQYVVYKTNPETGVAFYSVPITGPASAGVKLNGGPAANHDVDYFEISPDGSRVVYRYRVYQNQSTDGTLDLYSLDLCSVPIAGPASAGVKLTGALAANRGVSFYFRVSPDSSRVVYTGNQDTAEVWEIYSVPIAGPANAGVKLNKALVAGGYVDWYFRVSPDSSRVVYLAEQDTLYVKELYSVPLAGPASAGVKLNGGLAASGHVLPQSFRISPDSSRVVYKAGNLYSVPIAGPASASVKLNGALAAGGEVENFLISPDSSRVIYRYRVYQNPGDPHTLELYSVPIAGPDSAGVKLNETLAVGGRVQPDFRISPDSSRVVYLADQDTDGVFELYSVPLAGPASAGVKLNGTLAAGYGVDPHFWISPDSSRVVYMAPQDTAEVWELYNVPIAGPASAGVKLNGALVAGGDVDYSQISPDGSRVVYKADQDTYDVEELYSVPIAGPASASVKLNGPLVAGGDVWEYQVSADSSRVVYSADQDTDGVLELYVADDGQTQVGFDAATATAAEVAGSALLTVKLSGAAVLPVTVDYAVTGGTATGGGVDYTLAAGSLTFNPGQTSRTIVMTIVDDALEEPSETVVLTLSNPQNATLSAVTSTTLMIWDNGSVLYLPLVLRQFP